jgi:hypothetical protein
MADTEADTDLLASELVALDEHLRRYGSSVAGLLAYLGKQAHGIPLPDPAPPAPADATTLPA